MISVNSTNSIHRAAHKLDYFFREKNTVWLDSMSESESFDKEEDDLEDRVAVVADERPVDNNVTDDRRPSSAGAGEPERDNTRTIIEIKEKTEKKMAHYGNPECMHNPGMQWRSEKAHPSLQTKRALLAPTHPFYMIVIASTLPAAFCALVYVQTNRQTKE
jgi:hypothetical protein